MISVISSLESRHDKIKQLLTCPICNKLLRQVTAIDECLHIFCRKCITAKFTEEKLHKCPVCEVDLGVFPLQKLRADYRWQSIRNSMKFKRRQFIERGLIQRKKTHQASDANKPPAEVVLPSSESLSIINEEEEDDEDDEDVDDEDEDEDEDEEYSPLPVSRRKEKSISSVLRAEKRAARKPSSSSRGGRGRRGGRKSNNPPRRSSSSSIVVSVPTIKESSSNPVKSGNGERGTKQNIKPSNHEELSSNHDKKGKREMNPSLKLLDQIPATSKDTINNMSAPPSQPHPNITQETTDDYQENNNKGRKGKGRDNHHHHQSDGESTASVSRNNIACRSSSRRNRGGGSGSGRGSGSGGGGREKRAIVTEDLNLPAQVVLDASSSKCFRSNHIWFSLVASSDNQDNCVGLPPLPPYYLMIKDSNMPASFLKKYLVKKLSLSSENEVELTMRGRPIPPDSPVDKLVNLWKETTPELEKKPAMVGDSAKEYVMVVTYRRCAIPF